MFPIHHSIYCPECNKLRDHSQFTLCTTCSINVERDVLNAGKIAGFDTDNVSTFPRLHSENNPPRRKSVHSLSFLPPGGFK